MHVHHPELCKQGRGDPPSGQRGAGPHTAQRDGRPGCRKAGKGTMSGPWLWGAPAMQPRVERVRERDAQTHYCGFPVYCSWKAEWRLSRKLQEKCSRANSLRLWRFHELPHRLGVPMAARGTGTVIRVRRYPRTLYTGSCPGRQQPPRLPYRPPPGLAPCQSWEGLVVTVPFR